ncbi:unnamed protein product [Clonostachys rosea]|uniref:PARP-type domain-containing protein n=1 Tax=Bionectria ochroleuca TaxID=29856 RepID=A0ABY6TZB0_BIOOC|nr:unnamed protein product [Clonostachys rosea]
MADKQEKSIPSSSKRARSPEGSHEAEINERPPKRQDRHEDGEHPQKQQDRYENDENPPKRDNQGTDESSRKKPPLTYSSAPDNLDIWKPVLEDHIAEERRLGRAINFFVECSPHANGGSTCQLRSCFEKIEKDDYRVAVEPGMFSQSRADFYHVECFEKLADLTREKYLNRLKPLSRNNLIERNAKRSSLMNGYYLLDAGAERLVTQWIFVMRKLIAKRDGTDGPKSEDPKLHDLLYQSGSAKFTDAEQPEGMTDFEFRKLQTTLAPIESDGPEDDQEWNLFDLFMTITGDDEICEEGKTTLGSMLETWRWCWTVVNLDEQRLTEAGKKLKEEWGEKCIRAVKRLSKIPMPDLDAISFPDEW